MPPEGGDRRLADAEVTGEVVRAVLAGVEQFSPESREVGRATLAEHGFEDPTDEWYPLERCLAVIEEIAVAVGDSGVRALGESVPRAVADSASAPDVPTALSALDDAYRDHHRGDVGGYAFRQIGDADGRIECLTPYPCAFDRGVVEGTAAAVADRYVSLREVGLCPGDGVPRCTYELTW